MAPRRYFRVAGCLPVRHREALALVRLLLHEIPPGPTADLWDLAFRQFLQARTAADRAVARQNIARLHAVALTVPRSLLADIE